MIYKIYSVSAYTNRYIIYPILIVFAFGLVHATFAQDTTGEFRASVVKTDITPDSAKWLHGYGPRESDGVHDRIYHRVVAMDDGNNQFFLISSDVAAISPGFYDQFCREVEEKLGITRDQIWWTVTHTHSAPVLGPPGLIKIMLPERYEERPYPNPEYSREMKRRLIESLEEARSKLESARLGIGTGWARANINRRAEDVDGSISLGMNPDRPVDRQINLLRLERPDGSPIALVANYAMHGTALGSENLKISGDAPGIVAEYVEEKVGAPMLYINGAAGNVAPIYSVRPDFDSAHITEFNVLLGKQILNTNESVHHTTEDVTLWTGETIIESPRKDGFGWVRELDKYSRTSSTGTQLVRLPIRFLRINSDIMIWSAPVELFSQIATEIRRKSPYPQTFYFGYTNGFLGYLPVSTAFAEGGYEAGSVTPFTPEVQDNVTSGVLNYLDSTYKTE